MHHDLNTQTKMSFAAASTVQRQCQNEYDGRTDDTD